MIATDDAAIRAFLASCRTLAVVGLSPRADRPSHEVARALQARGLRILPVNPQITEVLGEPAWADVDSLPVTPDAVVVFRRPAEVPPIAAATIARGARGLWLQLGIRCPDAEEAAAAAGLFVTADRCIRLEYERLLGGPAASRD